MITNNTYKIQAFVPVDKDKFGRSIMGWTRVYAQINNTRFEYSTNKHNSDKGDFEHIISNCDFTRKGDSFRVLQNNKNDDFVEVRQDDEFVKDFQLMSDSFKVLRGMPTQ